MYGMNRHNVVELVLADEAEHVNSFVEKSIFITNLGIMLSQMKNGVRSLMLTSDDDIVISYKNDESEHFIIKGESYSDILLEIINHVLCK